MPDGAAVPVPVITRSCRCMKCDDLMANNAIACLECWRDCNCPAIIVRNQCVRGPSTGVAAANKSFLIDLKPFQSGLIDSLARSNTIGHVIEDGAVVACGPWCPLKFELCAYFYRRFHATWRCQLVTDNIWSIILCCWDKAITKICWCGPCNDTRRRTHILK